MLAGMRLAWHWLNSTDKLQEQFDAQMANLLPLMPAKLRYRAIPESAMPWRRIGAAFARLFGEEFSSACEEQFRQRHAAPPAPAGGSPPTK